MRGLLVVNPRATTTSPRVTDVIVHALSDEVDLDVTVTTHRGHAVLLGQAAVEQELDLVMTLGGDGVVNEVVNGMLARGPDPTVPLLAPIPGGSANVFARSLGIPTDPVEATGLLLDRLRGGSFREIGLGRANDRWFVANAGLGLDAEVIAAMERHRKAGHAATPTRYLLTTLTEFFRGRTARSPRSRCPGMAARGSTRSSSPSCRTPHRGPTSEPGPSIRARRPPSKPAWTSSWRATCACRPRCGPPGGS